MVLHIHRLAGVDIICAQGGEGGGHTGDTPFSILIPAVVELCKNAKSPLTGEPVLVVAAGGIADGRGLAASLASVKASFLNHQSNGRAIDHTVMVQAVCG